LTVSPTFAVLAYAGIEPIDIGATIGVFSMASRLAPALRSFVVARAAAPLAMAGGLRLIPDHDFATCPQADALIVLGGPGWPQAAADEATLAFIRRFHAAGGTVAAVCTGGLILAATGLLDGLPATTKREILAGEASPLAFLAANHPTVRATAARIVDTGRLLTGGGVTLGIDMSLHLLRRFCGDPVARETARILEYARAWHANAAALPDLAPGA
jgi:transcriptional regulator GlxA family with amidase domain